MTNTVTRSLPNGLNDDRTLLPEVKYAIKNRKKFLESAVRYGTPQYLLDETRLIHAAEKFKNAFAKRLGNFEFYYAFKSNDLPYIIQTLKRAGYNADVAGLFELQMALKLGFKKIIFTSPGKSEEELRLSVANRDRVVVNSDSLDEIEGISGIAAESKTKTPVRVSLRLKPAEAASQKWSKFGFTEKEAKKAVNMIVADDNLRWAGLHVHSSWNKTPKRQVANAKALGRLAEKLIASADQEIDFIDLGGGFYPSGEGELASATDYGRLFDVLSDHGIKTGLKPFKESDFFVEDPEPIEHFAREITAAAKSHILPRVGNKTKVILEPGRFLSSKSTVILLKVLSVRGDGSVVADGGMNMIGYDRFEVDYFPIVNLTRPSTKRSIKTIYGCLCDPHDFWGYSFYGSGIKKGDVLAVLNQGAYAFCLASRFIKPTAPYAVLAKDGKIMLARKREEFNQRYPELRA